MIAEHEDENQDNSLIQSTTIKTIRSLKNRNSYNNIFSNKEEQQSSNENTNIPTSTPSQHDDDTNYKIEELPKHKKMASNPGQVIKNPIRKNIQMKTYKQKSDPQINIENNDETTNIFGFNQDNNTTPVYQNENGTLTSKSAKNGNQTGKGSSLSKDFNRGSSSMSQIVMQDNKVVQQKEYIPIDMEYAIQFVLTKSKAIKDKIEVEGLHQAFITHHITKNKFFSFSYNSYLQSLMNHKILSPDFKNVGKKMFEKLEKFFIDRLEKCQETIAVQQNYVKKSKGVYSALDKRIQELKKELENKNKLQL